MTEVSQQVRGEWKPHLVRIVDRELAIFVSEGDEAPLKKVLYLSLSFHLGFSLCYYLCLRGGRGAAQKSAAAAPQSPTPKP